VILYSVVEWTPLGFALLLRKQHHPLRNDRQNSTVVRKKYKINERLYILFLYAISSPAAVFFLYRPFVSSTRVLIIFKMYIYNTPPGRRQLVSGRKKPNLIEKSTYYLRIIVIYINIQLSPSWLFISLATGSVKDLEFFYFTTYSKRVREK